ncbi:MAG TPA: bifunctional serine/threonine protein kinase/MFS transporter, partial [Thermoleophilaceae bacterium]
RLGAGGFGVVWLAWDEHLEREVAVKAIPREGEDERVEREARAAARLNHPGIVSLYELASDEHDTYLVSELVHGRTFRELMRAGALSDRDVARIGIALCDALEHAHGQGVIHRDVKPENVMVVAEPAVGSGFAKLADFGVAHVASGDPITRTGDVVGTLAYMAPEQAEGAAVDPASDVYSLALTLFEAWTGSTPVKGPTPAATARNLGRPLPLLADQRRDLPRDLADALDDALEVDPSMRPAPARLRRALARAEQALEDEGGLVEPATLARVGLTTGRRRGSLLGRRAAAATRVQPPEVEPLPRRFGLDERAQAGVLERGAYDDAPRGRFERAADGVLPAGESRASSAAAHADGSPRPGRIPLPRLLVTRAGAGLGAGALVLLALTQLGPTPPFDPAVAAGSAALAVALLPRLGWLAAVLGVCGWLASPEANREGTALVLVAAAAPVPLLLPRAGLLWSLPALAPLLGAIALGPAYVAIVGSVPASRPSRRSVAAELAQDGVLAARPPFARGLLAGSLRRAGLGVAGFVWLAAAEVISGTSLLFGVSDGTLPRGDWQGSLDAAATDALQPLLSSGVLVTALVWGLFAALLPLLVRGRQLALDALGAGLWAVGLIAALGAVGDLLVGETTLSQARGAVAGPILGAVAAVALAALLRPARDRPVAAPSDYPAMPR